MKPRISSMRRGESSLLDLLAMLVAVGIVVMLLGAYLARARGQVQPATCVNNLKQIGLSARLWSGDNNDKMPAQVSTNLGGTMELVAAGFAFPHFAVMSNEICTPRILVCPKDNNRRWAANFTALGDANLSYFFVPEADETMPTLWLSGDRNLATNNVPLRPGLFVMPTNRLVSWTAKMHAHQGNLAFADGSVQQLSDAGLRTNLSSALSAFQAVTNTTFRLVIP
jgi:prepilin-type processing-associated H-X9-DG protein